MSALFLVEAPDGSMSRKPAAALLPDDMLVFDGEESTASLDAAQAALEAEIAAAGGLEAWRRVAAHAQS